MARTLRIVLLSAMCAFIPVCASAASSWMVAAIDTDPWLPSTITFLLSGNQLLLNNTLIYQPGGSGAWSRLLHLTGTWAACGTVDVYGSLVADPYASFVILANTIPPPAPPDDGHYPRRDWIDAWYCLGYVRWSPDTPNGYAAPLMIGARFVGDGAVAYHYEDDCITSDAMGTVVLQDTYAYSHGHYGVKNYTALTHTFRVSQAPEPSSMEILLAALGGLGVIARRRLH